MLRFLRIRHFAVIDSVEVEFDPGLNVLTGESGAGKSILVEAVGLLLGDRASGDLVRTGEARPLSRPSSRPAGKSCSSAGKSRRKAEAARSSTTRSRRLAH